MQRHRRPIIELAQQSREYAFASRSEHTIGAAVLTAEGQLFGGCNIESNISGLGSCAERVAINHAIAHGHYTFTALATFDLTPVLPCGACLQYLAEFMPEGNVIIITATPKDAAQYRLAELLPHPYRSTKQAEKLAPYQPATHT